MNWIECKGKGYYQKKSPLATVSKKLEDGAKASPILGEKAIDKLTDDGEKKNHY
ncbi:hypothetical protein ACQKL5_11215 [Peribacillus sp. NPDC097675]|uniref:hypothetical protein n=1 Tax=Peribacillus sp. NPDC097675 TaxID=3390618 RepID=UPI003D044A31